MATGTRRPAGAEADRRPAGRYRASAAADHRTGPADFHVRARHGYYVAGHSDHERDLREGAHARSTGADARAG
ncbi:hypothetical protein EMIT040CA3_40101 [Bacillus pseudomycoides]